MNANDRTTATEAIETAPWPLIGTIGRVVGAIATIMGIGGIVAGGFVAMTIMFAPSLSPTEAWLPIVWYGGLIGALVLPVGIGLWRGRRWAVSVGIGSFSATACALWIAAMLVDKPLMPVAVGAMLGLFAAMLVLDWHTQRKKILPNAIPHPPHPR